MQRQLQFFLLILLFSVTYQADAQKYNFLNYSVENGLIQSQVLSITQDKSNELWLGTLGGVSRFDGTSFKNYNKSDDLPTNEIRDVKCDKYGNIWMATTSGVVKYDGRRFTTYHAGSDTASQIFLQIEIDKNNTVWAFGNLSIYSFSGEKLLQQRTNDTVLSCATSVDGSLYIGTLRNGILYHPHNTWLSVTDSSGKSNEYIAFKLWASPQSKTIKAITRIGTIEINQANIKRQPIHFLTPQIEMLQGMLLEIGRRIFEDSHGNLWMSFTDGGVWQLKDSIWTHYNYANGFTDDIVNSFFEDEEGNIWLGTNGSGLYRYASQYFTYYDKSNGLSGSSILSITQNPVNGKVYVNNGGFGLYTFDKEKPLIVDIGNTIGSISSIDADDKGNIWMCYGRSPHLWYYNGSRVVEYKDALLPQQFSPQYLTFENSALWVATLEGDVLTISNDKLSILKTGLKQPITTLLVDNADSIFLGTPDGVYVYNLSNKTTQLITKANVTSFTNDADNIYIGTDDRGVLQWNKNLKKFHQIATQQGLSCNFVYSLLRDEENNIWAGTGCGIDKISISDNKITIKTFGRSDGLTGVENNVNASFKDDKGNLWFGTTRGLFRFNSTMAEKKLYAPKVVLQSVKLFSKDLKATKVDSIIPFENIPFNPQFAPGQNHITFTFKGIYLSNPEKVKYRYQLLGAEKKYTETDQNTIVFSSLPSGAYTLRIWASDGEGNWYDNALDYPFTIRTPFYQTWWFRIAALLFLSGLILLLVYARNRQKTNRLLWEQRLREEEQARVRQKTAEDFHDEIGNKLTRINLLTTIVESKTANDSALKDLLQQIKQNIASLYNGSKDIIWMLQPHSDYLDEILLRLEQVSQDLLQGAPIEFQYNLTNKGNIHLHQKMPIDYSRNILMIFKEALNNSVKYANATVINLDVIVTQGLVKISLRDNGTGFDMHTEQTGNGLINMRNRANRIKANLYIESSIRKGTVIVLLFNIHE